jgi:glucose-6-phosphate isomerase
MIVSLDSSNLPSISLDITNALADTIGEHGVGAADLEGISAKLEAIKFGIDALHDEDELPFLNLPDQNVSDIVSCASALTSQFDTFVVVGIGGSALGNISNHTALRHPYHNDLPASQRRGMRVEVPDNVDPVRIAGLLDTLDLKRTAFNVITKSGSTAETMSTFLVIKHALQSHPEIGADWTKHIVATTDPEKGDLRRLATELSIPMLSIPPGVGGRFSVLTPVGLLSASASGIDITELLSGAKAMVQRIRETAVDENPAYIGAAIQYLLYNHDTPKPMSVMMPYAHSLRDVADWFRQLWAESLGKEKNLDGDTVNVGPTPIRALGATDQHSQVQLYAEGPNDKIYTFLSVDQFATEVEFAHDDDIADYNAFNYFGGKTMGQLLNAEREATTLALTRKGRPNLTIGLPEVTSYTVGQLYMLLEIQTVVAGALFGIDPFDQPGVEAGKVATYALMDRPGYEDEKRDIERELASRDRVVL